MKRSIFTLFFALLAAAAMAQSGKGRVKGVITDKTTKEFLPGATVALLHAKDSSIEASAFADKNGAFDIQGIEAGKYQLFVTYIGYQGFYKSLTISDSTKVIELGGITLEQKGVSLGGVEIVETVPIKVKQDTIEFNAGSFKTRENALTEDLLKKLPGVVVDKDGVIKANGETVTKVYVDGKPFFGNDPKMSTRNLPADMIDKVQLIDKKSDQAEFTGINDGEIEKVINLTIKAGKKKGIFGRATAGYGTDDRYSANGNVARFQDAKKMMLVAGANNTNGQDFTFTDRFNFGGGGGNGGRSGLSEIWNGGLTFSDEYGKKKNVRLSANYRINDVDRESSTISKRESLNNGTGRKNTYSYDTAFGLNKNLTHHVDMRLEYDIDSFHSIIFNPNFDYSKGDNYSTTNGYQELVDNKDFVNINNRVNTNNATRPEFNGDLQFRKKFRKRGRTLSFTLGYGYNGSDQESTTQSYVLDSMGRESIVNQRVNSDNSSTNYNFRVDYTEPIFTDRFLELGYSYRNNLQDNDRRTYQFNENSKGYDDLDEAQTNIYHNSFENQQASISVRTQKLKYDYSIGGRLQINDQLSDNRSKNQVTEQHVVNFAPEVRFNYTFSRNKRLRFNYRGQTNQATIAQLAPVPDSSNPLLIQVGNPDLKPSFTHSFGGSFNSFDAASMYSMQAGLNVRYVTNQIIYSSELMDNGGTRGKYVNVSSGNYSIDGNLSNGIPLFHKKTTLNLNTNLGYSRAVSLRNNISGITKNISAGERVNLSYFYKELFDVALGGNLNYTAARFNADSVKKTATNNYNYYDYGLSFDFNVNIPYGFRVGADMDYTANRGRGEEYDLDYTMVNAFLSKTLFKNKKGEIKAKVFDLFRQNIAISRSVSENFVTDRRNMVLQRYFMFSFTYVFGKFGGGGNRRGNMPPGEMREFRGFPGGGQGGAGGGGFRRG